MTSRNDPCAKRSSPTVEGMGRGARKTGGGPAGHRGRSRYWTDARITSELDVVLKDWRGPFFPSARQLRQLGRRDLLAAMETYGGLTEWARRTGMRLGPRQDRSPYGHAEATVDALEVIDKLGALPGDHRLKKLGKVRLASYLANRIEGRRAFLRSIGFDDAEAARLCDLSGVPRSRRWSAERLQRELAELLAGRDEWPADSFFTDAGRTDVLAAVRRYGGKRTWARKLGLDYRRPGRSY